MTWRRVLAAVAVAWALVNVLGGVFAAVQGEPVHAAVHALLAVAFGIGARWLWRDPRAGRRDNRVETLQDEVSELQRQLNEAQESRDFAEQLLAQRTKTAEPDPLRYAPRQNAPEPLRRSVNEEPESNR